MWAPSTSASVRMTILWYRALEMSNSSPIPVPIAVMSDCTSLFCSTRASRFFSTLMILPRIGKIAWNSLFRACFADPPAESPSTMNSSLTSGSFEEQSDSLPGRPDDSSRLLRRVRSLACRAACRARAALAVLSAIRRPSPGFRSSHSGIAWFRAFSTNDRISVLPSFVFVCPSNCGWRTLAETTAVMPSRTSSPIRFRSFSFRMLRPRAKSFTALVSALRKPSSWVPPSWVLMLLAKLSTVSV